MADDFDQAVMLENHRSGVQATREVGVKALKTIMTLDSGAFVVLLTFIGNTAAQSRFVVPLWNLKVALYLFLSGIALAFVSMAYTYVASQEIGPYRREPKKADGWFAPVIVCVTGLAVIAFLVGVLTVI